MKRFGPVIIVTAALLMGLYGTSSAETAVKGSYYLSPYTYKDSPIKDKGFSAGLHTHLVSGEHHSFEIAFDYSRIDLKRLNDLRMWDYTALYTYHPNQWRISGGLHYTSANQRFIDGAVTPIVGVSYHNYGKWHAGLNAYFTYYNDSDPELQIFQLTPELGYNLYKTRSSAMGVIVRGYFIHAKDDDILGLDDSDFESLELELAYRNGNLTLRGFGWVGEQIFAKKDRGFDSYSLPEKHDGGVGAGLDYLMEGGMRSTIEVAMERFEDIGFGNDAEMYRITLMLSHPF